jgi:hypothetical protein
VTAAEGFTSRRHQGEGESSRAIGGGAGWPRGEACPFIGVGGGGSDEVVTER